MWAVLGCSQGVCGRSWPLLGLLWAVLGRDQVGKWPKPERESDPTGGAPERSEPPEGCEGREPSEGPDRSEAQSQFFQEKYTRVVLSL